MSRPRSRPPLTRRFALMAPLLAIPWLFGAIGGAAELRTPVRVAVDDEPVDPRATVAGIDRLLAEHWRAKGITPAVPADDDEYLRRLTLDLVGRTPTVPEQTAYLAEPAATRRTRAIDRLLDSPEFPLHLARVVDDWVQRGEHGDEAFVGWLRQSLAESRSWSRLFERVMVGPWNDEADKPAARFLAKRAKNIDALTADTARAFFGVDITCARCHDHPLVDDWKQDHYYGMAAFLHRTQGGGKDKATVSEKPDGELTFESRSEGQKTAEPLYLTERAPDGTAKGSRRALLVTTALEERNRFSRAAANRLWAWFFGRGLVEPVDQMHSANRPTVPGVLELLAGDLADNGYDLKRTARIIVSTRAYGLGGRTPAAPEPGSFAAASLRPLSPRQYALSLVLATGEAGFATTSGAERSAAYLAAEKLAAPLLPALDETFDAYRPGVGEALYLSNHEAIQKLFVPQGSNLAARLAGEASHDKRIDEAFRTILGRSPSDEERAELARIPASELLWILATSVENRFNH